MRVLAFTLTAIAVLLLLSGLILFTFESLNYLNYGKWRWVSLLDATGVLGSDWAFTKEPKTWIGLHKILDEIPLNVTLVLTGLFCFTGARSLRRLA
jgi:hypothetical protein